MGNLEQRKTHIALLIAASRADNSIHPMENKLIMDIALKLGISSDELKDVVENQGNLVLEFPEGINERMKIFYEILVLMKIDGEISPNETQLCKDLGFKLIGNPALIDDLIQLMIQSANANIPIEKLLKAVQKYLN